MELNEYLGKLIHMIKNTENVEFFAERPRLTRTEFRMLREIVIERDKGRDIISSELARRLGVTRSAISQLVAKLEKEGIVERASSPTDKKIAYIRLSEKSLALYEGHCDAANRLMALIVEDLGAKKLDALFAANEEFFAAVARARKRLAAENEPAKEGRTTC